MQTDFKIKKKGNTWFMDNIKINIAVCDFGNSR